MSALNELRQFRVGLSAKIDALVGERDHVDATIKILERHGGMADRSGGESTTKTSVATQTVVVSPVPAGSGPTTTTRDLGLTQACRVVIEEGKWTTPLEVRDKLISTGYDAHPSKLLNSVHPTLRRMADTGELKMSKIEGKTSFTPSEVELRAKGMLREM